MLKEDLKYNLQHRNCYKQNACKLRDEISIHSNFTPDQVKPHGISVAHTTYL